MHNSIFTRRSAGNTWGKFVHILCSMRGQGNGLYPTPQIIGFQQGYKQVVYRSFLRLLRTIFPTISRVLQPVFGSQFSTLYTGPIISTCQKREFI